MNIFKTIFLSFLLFFTTTGFSKKSNTKYRHNKKINVYKQTSKKLTETKAHREQKTWNKKHKPLVKDGMSPFFIFTRISLKKEDDSKLEMYTSK